MRRFFWLRVIAVFAPSFAAISANANPLYFEIGGGLGSMSGSGMGANATLAYYLVAPYKPISVHFGVQARTVSAGTNSVRGAYPLLRFEWGRLNLGFGASPLLYVDSGNGMTKLPSGMGILSEAIFRMPITPEIDFGLAASMESISGAPAGTPTSDMTFTAFFRLFYFLGEEKSGGSHSGYQGWRYPYGVEKN